MNLRHRPSDLAPEAASYLDRMRSLERPIDLVDRIMAEVEGTPQARPGLAVLPKPVMVAAAVAAVLVAVALLLRFGQPNVGPQPSPSQVPSGQLPSAGTVLNRFPTISTYEPAVVGDGFLWMEDEVRGELIRVDLETGNETAIDIIRDSAGGAVRATVDETSVWVFDGATNELVEIDPESAEEVRRIPIGCCAGRFAVAGGVAWLADSEAKTLSRIDLEAEEVDLSVPLQATGVLLIDGESLWVGREDGALTRLNAVTGAVEDEVTTQVVAFKLFRIGDTIVVDGGSSGIVSVDVGSMEVTGRVSQFEEGQFDPSAPAFTGVAAGDGRLWATNESGQLLELDPTSLQPLAALSLDLTELQVVYGVGALWTVGTDTSGNGVLLQVEPAQ
jgi:streptogramin lyase